MVGVDSSPGRTAVAESTRDRFWMDRCDPVTTTFKETSVFMYWLAIPD